jgi:hypothetical protein
MQSTTQLERNQQQNCYVVTNATGVQSATQLVSSEQKSWSVFSKNWSAVNKITGVFSETQLECGQHNRIAVNIAIGV